MRVYVSLDGVSEEQLQFLGYILISENDEFRVYYHLGEEVIVEKADPFIYVEDLNDAALFGSEIFRVKGGD